MVIKNLLTRVKFKSTVSARKVKKKVNARDVLDVDIETEMVETEEEIVVAKGEIAVAEEEIVAAEEEIVVVEEEIVVAEEEVVVVEVAMKLMDTGIVQTRKIRTLNADRDKEMMAKVNNQTEEEGIVVEVEEVAKAQTLLTKKRQKQTRILTAEKEEATEEVTVASVVMVNVAVVNVEVNGVVVNVVVQIKRTEVKVEEEGVAEVVEVTKETTKTMAVNVDSVEAVKAKDVDVVHQGELSRTKVSTKNANETSIQFQFSQLQNSLL